jgi:hypothetical protein
MLTRLVSITLVILGILCAGARAQESASSAIVGLVTDATHGALPGATVTVTQIGTGAQRVVVSDSEGRFSVPGLRPAVYSIKAELVGFNPAEIREVALRNGETIRPALALSIGSVSEQITVTGAAPLLETASASVGAVINERMLEELPIVGRTLLNIATTAPGVSPRSFQQNTQYGRRDQYVTVEGGRDSSTNYAIDGVYVRSLRFNNMSLNPPIDTVQEVNVLRNSFSTEYGQGSAVVSMVTKSGSNLFSGTASEYFRNDALNAKNYFAPTKPTYERNQFGFAAGGPLLRSKIFLFGGYEGTRETQGEVQIATAITDSRWLSGDFSGSTATIRDPLTGLPFPNNQIPAGRISQFARSQIGNVPIANLPGAVNNYRVIRNFDDDTDTVTFRSDQQISQNHATFQRFIWYDSAQVLPAATTFGGRPQKGKNLAAGYTWVVSSSIVNETRFGYNYAYATNYNFLPGLPDYTAENYAALAGLRNIQGALEKTYRGYPGATITGVTGPPNTGVFQGATENVYSFSNATTKVLGGHNLRFGFQGQWRKFYQSTPVGQNGAFTFNGRATGLANNSANAFADFLLGFCSTCAGQFGTADSTYRSPTLAPFIDDVWAVNSKLTIQAGLRWEYIAPWHEIDDIEATFDPASGKIAFHKVPANIPPALLPLVNTTDNFYPEGIVTRDFNNFGPRVGVVYSLNDSTALRAGFGLYYDNLNLNELQFMRLVPPFAGRYDLSPAGTALVNVADLFPDINSVTSFPAPFAIDPENETAYTKQWNVNVQRTLGRNLVLEVAYTGSRSSNEHKRFNINQPAEGTTAQALRLPYPSFAPAILTSSDSGHGDFEAVSVRIDKRFADGFFFTGSYQLSRNRDNNSGEVEANDTAFAWNHEADYGYSRNDQRHRSTITFGYELPSFGSGFLHHVLGDWQASGNIRLQSGRRFSVSVNALQSLGSFVPSRANFAPGREEDKGKLDDASAARWFDPTAYTQPAAGFQGTAGRNTLVGPAFRRVDLSVTKRVPFGAARRVDFRVEIFNALNTVNFGNPNANISNANVGTITTADDPRTVQLSLRVNW